MGNRMPNQHCRNNPISKTCLQSRTFLCRSRTDWQCLKGASTTDFRTLTFTGFQEFSLQFASRLYQAPGVMIELAGSRRSFVILTVEMSERMTGYDTYLTQTVNGSQLERLYALSVLAYNVSHMMMLFLFELKRKGKWQASFKIMLRFSMIPL